MSSDIVNAPPLAQAGCHLLLHRQLRQHVGHGPTFICNRRESVHWADRFTPRSAARRRKPPAELSTLTPDVVHAARQIPHRLDRHPRPEPAPPGHTDDRSAPAATPPHPPTPQDQKLDSKINNELRGGSRVSVSKIGCSRHQRTRPHWLRAVHGRNRSAITGRSGWRSRTTGEGDLWRFRRNYLTISTPTTVSMPLSTVAVSVPTPPLM